MSSTPDNNIPSGKTSSQIPDEQVYSKRSAQKSPLQVCFNCDPTTKLSTLILGRPVLFTCTIVFTPCVSDSWAVVLRAGPSALLCRGGREDRQHSQSWPLRRRDWRAGRETLRREFWNWCRVPNHTAQNFANVRFPRLPKQPIHFRVRGPLDWARFPARAYIVRDLRRNNERCLQHRTTAKCAPQVPTRFCQSTSPYLVRVSKQLPIHQRPRAQ